MNEQDAHEGERRMDRYIGMKIIEAGWEIRELYLDQDMTYFADGIVGVWVCEIDMNPRRRFWQEPELARGSGLVSRMAIEDAYNHALRVRLRETA